jgi:glutathione S-transferase
VAREAGVAIDLDRVDLKARTTQTGQSFAAVNPKGYVPALGLDSGEVLTEVSALVQYLADQAPQATLMPKTGTPERYKALEWIGFVATEIHKGFGALWNPTTPEDVKQGARDRLFQRFALLDKHLAGKSYLLGEGFTVADAYLFTVTNWTNFHGMSLADYPNLSAFMGRVAARPKVQEALRAEGLLKEAA